MVSSNSLFRRSLVFGIIILFIGAGIVPSMSGYTEKTSIQSTKETSTNLPLNNNYVNAYWKFDEGNGSIAYDSSGHGYDGIINGATWTTGHSGSALDFDGIDDYVGLDAYSENLGFNKTDDYKISVWINSTSTATGIIYSMSNSIGDDPMVYLELDSDGNLVMQVWIYQICGISVSSDGTYNDGDWHYVEAIFHGNTSNPTLEIYVDDELDGSITDWVCPFYADEFERAKIGSRSNDSTWNFDGVIDEVKVYKNPDGNQPPNLPNISGPTLGIVYEEYNYTFVTTDPEGDDIYYYIEWGDGNTTDWIGPYSSDEEFNMSHTWSENGTYEIRAKAKDTFDVSDWSDSYVVRIGNQAPDAPEITGPQLGDIGVEYNYTFVATDFEGDDIYLYIDWGDGDTEEWIGPYLSYEEVTVNHSWDEMGTYDITAKARDVYDYEGDWSDSYVVRIGNQAPDAPEITGPQLGNMGVEYNYTFVTTDPEGDDIYYYIEWGDGANITDLGPCESGEEVTLSHIWGEKGIYTIKARARDIFGAFGDEDTLKVVIPRNRRAFNFNFNLLEWLFERFPNVFPLIIYLQGV